LDDHIIQSAIKNRAAWFKPNVADELITSVYTSMLTVAKEEERRVNNKDPVTLQERQVLRVK